MFSFFRRKKSSDIEVPKWASFFDGMQYTEFLKVVDEYFRSKGQQYTIEDGVINAPDFEGGFDKMGLLNLAQNCNQDKPRNYKKIVTGHFEKMITAHHSEVAFKNKISDFNYAKQYIAVRLHDKPYLESVGMQNLLTKHIVSDIYAMMVFDLPDSIVSIKPEQTENWGKSFDELFDLGFQNAKKNPIKISKEKLDDFSIWFVQSNHFFTPNIVLELYNYPHLIGSKGTLIGIPHRHAVLIYPIDNMEVVTAINKMIPIIYGMCAEGPGSISNKLFWYKDQEIEELPYKIEQDKIQFYPTEKFTSILNDFSLN